MKTKILLIACSAAAAVQLFAQEKPHQFSNEISQKPYTINQYIEELGKREIHFIPPKGFQQSKINIKYLNEAFPSRFPLDYLALQSDDKKCTAVYNKPFAITLMKYEDEEDPTDETARSNATSHRASLSENLQLAYGPNIDIDDYLTINSGKKAKKQFNVDTVYIFSVPLNNEHLKPYTYGVSITMRRSLAFMGAIYLLLTDEGYKNMDKYMSKIDRSILCPDDLKNIMKVYKIQPEVPLICPPRPGRTPIK